MANYDTNTSTSALDNKVCPLCHRGLAKQPDGSFLCACGYSEHLTTTPYTHDEIRRIFAEQDKQVNVNSGSADVTACLYGWICPKCGSVMSPYTNFCPNCTKHNFEITCTSNTSNLNTQSNIHEPLKAFDVNQFIGGRKNKLGYE